MENSTIDLLIRIKNGYMASLNEVKSPYSRFREDVLKKLIKLGFVKDYQIEGEKIKTINIELLYNDNVPALTEVEFFSKPGRRYYVNYKHLKPVLGGLGFSIISTSKGILTNKEARKMKIGGELLFNIW